MALLQLKANAQTCPDVGATRKKVASSFHTTIMIDHTGAVKYWGENSSPTGSTSATSPQTLPAQSYAGTPLAVAATSYYTSAWSHMHYLLTSDSLYGWGAIDGPSGGYRAMTSIALPATLNGANTPLVAADIEFITASGGGLAIVTRNGGRTNGEVYVRNPGSTGGGTVYGYGDGTTTGAMNSAWHQVKLDATAYLHGVTRLSYSQKALMALSQANQVYVWGEQVWTADGIVGNQPFATQVINMPAVTVSDVNIISRVSYDPATVQYATQFVLGTNGRLYGIGEGYRGILGQGNDNDAASWIQVKSADGTGVLENIVQISSNNTHVYFLTSSNQNYYSIGALNSDGQLFMWGDNSKSMIGGTASSYSLPTIPPNFNVNDARVGYFCMGGHTTLAFLKGTNRFCYIGHRINGSMGDGTSTDNTNPSYDCINTPNAYICPPPAPLGCATASANDLLASSVNATIVINGQPAASYWGESSSSAEAGQNVPLPRTLYEYNGTPRGVAASGVSTAGMSGTQMWILSDAGIWGWGYSAGTINAASANTGLTKMALPAGVAIGDVSFIRSSKGGLALVTVSGNVWIKAGAGSACTPAVYGDGSTGPLDGNWHEVTTGAGTALSGIIELSFGGSAAMAVAANGTVYVWGNNTYDGAAGPVTRDRAAAVTLHADFTGATPVTPRKAEIIQTGTDGAAQFVLGSNGKVYSVGSNLNGVLGIGAGADQTTWSQLPISNIQRLSSNNPFPDGYYSIGALTASGTLYLWGSNSNGMLGGGATASYNTPTIPALSALGAGVTATDNVNGFEMGGRQTIIFTKPIAANPDNRFLFAGLNAGGAKGDANPAPAATTYTTFTFGAGVINCAGAVYSMSGHVYHDPNGTKDTGGGLVFGNKINSVAGAPVLYVNLLDESGIVINTTPLAADGSYSFANLPAASYTIQIATVAGGLFNPAPAPNLPASWAFAGEQSGTVAGAGLNTGSNAGTGRMGIILSDNTPEINFGLQQRPVADAKSFIIARSQFRAAGNPPANFPVRANYNSIPVSHAAFTGYSGSAQGSLSGSDAEDCAGAGSCNTGTGRSFRVSTIASNTELWYYNGTTAVQVAAGQIIPDFNAANLVVYGRVGSGNTADPLGFTYRLIDAGGAESAPASYSISTGSTTPLPVVLEAFSVTAGADCMAVVSWKVGTENGVASYDVQQSADAQGFVSAGNVPATGSGSTYSYRAPITAKGTNYYRLLIRNQDGTYHFSNTARIDAFCSSHAAVSLSPNPVTSTLQVSGLEAGDLLEVYNAIGQMAATARSREAGHLILPVNDLPAGIYILRIKDGNGAAVSAIRFVKQ